MPGVESIVTSERSQKNKRLIVGLSIPAVLVIIVLAVIFLRGFIGGEKAKEVKDYSTAQTSVSQEFARLEQGMNLQPLKTSNYIVCNEGQNNYKVKLGYNLVCTFKQTRFYGVNTDFVVAMKQLQEVTTKNGWVSDKVDGKLPLQYSIEDYEDTLRYTASPYGEVAMPSGSSIHKGNFKEVGYKILEVEVADKNSTRKDIQLDFIDYQTLIMNCCSVQAKHKEVNFSLEDFDALAQKSTFVMAIAIEQNYYIDPHN